MWRSVAIAAIAGIGLAHPGPAAAQDRTAVSEDPVANDAVGWAWFGGQLGFFVGGAAGAAGTIAVARSLPEPDPAAPDASQHGPYPLLALGAATLTLGGTVLGAWGLHELAADGGWDADAGWGASGVLPGVMEGIALAGGTVMLADRDAPLGPRLSALALGTVGGGALGYALFRQMGRARGGAAWETAMFWVGFLVGEVAGIVASQSGPERHDHLVLLGAAAGGALTTAATHLLATLLDQRRP